MSKLLDLPLFSATVPDPSAPEVDPCYYATEAASTPC